MKKHIDYLNSVAKNIQLAREFCAKHTIPEGLNIAVSCSSIRVSGWCYDSDRETILAEAGEAFGKSNWVEKAEQSRYDWEKQIGEVVIYIYAANQKPVEVDRPIEPKEFPLLLTNVAA
jgi:hypothetical protein